MRHTYSTLSLDSGIDPKILSDRVVHSNPSVTFQVYTHAINGSEDTALEVG
jgi:integrase